MSWLGDVGNFEYFNLGKMGQQIGKNPLRLAYGSADPFSTKVWNGILGTNDKPLVDQYGGAAPQRYQEAKDAGINTGPGATMHGIARTIVGAVAGGYGANALGGSGSAAGGAGSTAGNTGSSALSDGLLGSGNQVNLGNSAKLMNGSENPYLLSSSGGPVSGTSSSPGLLEQFSSTYGKYKPALDAAKTGMDMFGGSNQAPVQPQQPQQYGNPGPQVLAELAKAGQTDAQNTLNASEQARQQRRMMRRGLM